MNPQAFATILMLLGATPALAQIDFFRHDPAKVPVGTVFHYEKSNIDGTRKSPISLYVAAPDRIESLKWHPGSDQATLVTAELDWQRFSVRRLHSYSLTAGKEPALKATLEHRTETNRLHIAAAGQEWQVEIKQWPWHSYDFDFASLNLTLPHLIHPTRSFRFGIADLVRRPEGPAFAYKGEVDCTFLNVEKRHGQLCRKYRLNGPGLEQRGGFLWVGEQLPYLVDYEIELPDEPGFRNGKLRLLSIARMTQEQWKNFKAAPGQQGKPPTP